MLKLKKFLGINNVLPQERLLPSRDGLALTEALNVDVNNDYELLRRRGFTQDTTGCFHNVYETLDFLLATNEDGALVSLDGGIETVLYPALGQDRVWYCTFPDGRIGFSNGLINGIVAADGASVTDWGVPVPPDCGSIDAVNGELNPGNYRISVTYKRTVDGRESGTVSGQPVSLPDGGFMLTNLVTLAGHSINVYVTSKDGEKTYFAGNTTTSMFAFVSGKNVDLVQRSLTDNLRPAPIGILCAFWNSRALIAVGRTLYASLPGQWEHFDLARDWKTFEWNITSVVGIDEGIYVGTENELGYMKGREFDKLEYSGVVQARVAKGSGVAIEGERVVKGDGTGNGHCALFIANGEIVAGFEDGSIERITQGRYTTNAQEVIACVRMRDNTPQYVALIVE